MKKKAVRVLLVLLAILLLIAALCAVYFFCFERFVLVQDPAWGYLLPQSARLSLRLELAKTGKRLVTVNVTSSELSDQVFLTPIFLDLQAKEVLLSPIVSQCVVNYNLDVSDLLGDCIVYGLWNESCSLFDATIISDVNSGWLQAASTLKTMSQNVGVVYDSLGTSAFQTIKSEISGSDLENGLVEYLYDAESHLYFSSTLSDMNEKQIVLALCPHLSDFNNFFSLDNSVSWIVDYRYAKMVPKKQLYGVVSPNLASLVKALDQSPATKNCEALYTMEYKYDAK